jgi:DNA-binding transcriptional regulator YiaG
MYHYTESGLQNIWLKDGYKVVKTPYGKGVAVQDLAGLHDAIGRSIALRPRMTGAELRFLRKEIGLSQRALGELIGTSEQNISLWERRGRIPKVSDRMIKLIYLEHAQGNVKIRELIERQNNLDVKAQERLKFEKKPKWKEAA